MAQITGATKRSDGKFVINYDDATTKIVDEAGAKKLGIDTSAPVSQPTQSSSSTTSYNQNLGGAYSDTTANKTVLIDGKIKTVSEAIDEARNVTNLGQIRSNLLKYGQLTKAEARDPNNLLSKWAQIVSGAANDPKNNDPFAYAKALQQQGFQSTTGVQQYDPYAQVTVYDPTKAADFITTNFNKLLHRDPTPEELTKYADDLNKEQTKPSSASKTTYKMVNGVRTSVTTTGLDEAQWLATKLQSTDEFKKIQERINSASAQQLQSAASANGISLTPQQISDFTARIAKGESVDTFKSILRDQAALGQPEGVKKLLGQGVDLESIYSPYKNSMAKVLEINPQTITLDDPVLRSAIRPEGEMSIYDYQRALRKDPRWQYTSNAKDEVASSVTKVLQDFGFKG
jgi:hypothetical protein